MNLLPLLLAVSACAGDFPLPLETKTLTAEAKTVAAGNPIFGAALRHGVWGGGRGDRLPATTFRPKQLSPLDPGFKALGPTGKTGSVDGPGSQGNGRYRVISSEPYQVVLEMKTGYIDGRFTLKRDTTTGKDSLGFSGRLWDQSRGAWAAPTEGINDGLITYDSGKDNGRIKWKENGAWKDEGYWNGRAGNKSMTIEFGGGWDHDLSQD